MHRFELALERIQLASEFFALTLYFFQLFIRLCLGLDVILFLCLFDFCFVHDLIFVVLWAFGFFRFEKRIVVLWSITDNL